HEDERGVQARVAGLVGEGLQVSPWGAVVGRGELALGDVVLGLVVVDQVHVAVSGRGGEPAGHLRVVLDGDDVLGRELERDDRRALAEVGVAGPRRGDAAVEQPDGLQAAVLGVQALERLLERLSRVQLKGDAAERLTVARTLRGAGGGRGRPRRLPGRLGAGHRQRRAGRVRRPGRGGARRRALAAAGRPPQARAAPPAPPPLPRRGRPLVPGGPGGRGPAGEALGVACPPRRVVRTRRGALRPLCRERTDAADLSFRLVTANVYRPGRFPIEPTSKETVSPLTAAVAMTRPATGRLFQEVPVSSQSPDSVRSSTVRGRLSGRSKVSSTRALVMRGVERGTSNAR